MDKNVKVFQSCLEAYIRDAKERYEELQRQESELRKRQEELREEATRVNSDLHCLSETRRFHEERVGRPRPVSEIKLDSSMCLKDACRSVLIECGDMSKRDLKEAVQRMGFRFTTTRIGQAIHCAVLNDPLVNITENGICQWRGEDG